MKESIDMIKSIIVIHLSIHVDNSRILACPATHTSKILDGQELGTKHRR